MIGCVVCHFLLHKGRAMTIQLRQTAGGKWCWALVRERSACGPVCGIWNTTEIVAQDGPYDTINDATTDAEDAYQRAEKGE